MLPARPARPPQARADLEGTKKRIAEAERRVDAEIEPYIKKNYWTEAREQLRRQVRGGHRGRAETACPGCSVARCLPVDILDGSACGLPGPAGAARCPLCQINFARLKPGAQLDARQQGG